MTSRKSCPSQQWDEAPGDDGAGDDQGKYDGGGNKHNSSDDDDSDNDPPPSPAHRSGRGGKRLPPTLQANQRPSRDDDSAISDNITVAGARVRYGTSTASPAGLAQAPSQTPSVSGVPGTKLKQTKVKKVKKTLIRYSNFPRPGYANYRSPPPPRPPTGGAAGIAAS